MDIRLLEQPFDAVAAHGDFVSAHGALGAVASFIGVVRAAASDAEVGHLYLDWYPGMTEASIQAIADAAVVRFEVPALAIWHRCGRVEAGQPVVFVAAASPHRRAAFEAVDYAMDRLKSEAAFWKREVGPELDRWVEPTAGDARDLERWTKE
jgi:molybdopterin synthase catalytic subunit